MSGRYTRENLESLDHITALMMVEVVNGYHGGGCDAKVLKRVPMTHAEALSFLGRTGMSGTDATKYPSFYHGISFVPHIGPWVTYRADLDGGVFFRDREHYPLHILEQVREIMISYFDVSSLNTPGSTALLDIGKALESIGDRSGFNRYTLALIVQSLDNLKKQGGYRDFSPETSVQELRSRTSESITSIIRELYGGFWRPDCPAEVALAVFNDSFSHDLTDESFASNTVGMTIQALDSVGRHIKGYKSPLDD